MKTTDSRMDTAPTTTSSSFGTLKSSSSSHLQPELRDEMGALLGHDFRSVRVVTDRTTSCVIDGFGADAVTLENTIAFGTQKYNPASTSGRRLIAHELTHVVQQSKPGPPGTTAGAELEADSASRKAAAGQRTEVSEAVPAVRPMFKFNGVPTPPHTRISSVGPTIDQVYVGGEFVGTIKAASGAPLQRKSKGRNSGRYRRMSYDEIKRRNQSGVSLEWIVTPEYGNTDVYYIPSRTRVSGWPAIVVKVSPKSKPKPESKKATTPNQSAGPQPTLAFTPFLAGEEMDRRMLEIQELRQHGGIGPEEDAKLEDEWTRLANVVYGVGKAGARGSRPLISKEALEKRIAANRARRNISVLAPGRHEMLDEEYEKLSIALYGETDERRNERIAKDLLKRHDDESIFSGGKLESPRESIAPLDEQTIQGRKRAERSKLGRTEEKRKQLGDVGIPKSHFTHPGVQKALASHPATRSVVERPLTDFEVQLQTNETIDPVVPTTRQGRGGGKKGGNVAVIPDPVSGETIGYGFVSGGYFEIYDVNGQLIRSGEEPIESSAVQADDLLIVGTLAKGIGKGALVVAKGSLRALRLGSGLGRQMLKRLRLAVRAATKRGPHTPPRLGKSAIAKEADDAAKLGPKSGPIDRIGKGGPAANDNVRPPSEPQVMKGTGTDGPIVSNVDDAPSLHFPKKGISGANPPLASAGKTGSRAPSVARGGKNIGKRSTGRRAQGGARRKSAGRASTRRPKRVSPKARSRLRDKGYSNKAIDALARAGLDFTKPATMKSMDKTKSTVINFANEFNDRPGFDLVIQQWRLGGNNQAHARLIMRRALRRFRRKEISFEYMTPQQLWTSQGQAASPRIIDLTIPSKTGVVWEEMKYWSLTTLKKSASKVRKQLARDVAFQDLDKVRWVFDKGRLQASLNAADLSISPRRAAVEEMVKIVNGDDFLKLKFGRTPETIRKNVNRMVKVE